MPASNRSSGRSSPSSLPPTDPASPAHSSFPSTSTSLAQFIQHKRRQASAPYYASARSQSLFSPGAGFSLGPSSIEAGTAAAAAAAIEDGGQVDVGVADRAPSRPRSRAASRRATAMGISLQTTGLAAPEVDGGLVVTPTTEEWRVLGSELSDLASLQAQQAQQEEAVALERRAEKEAAQQEREGRKAPKWKRWPSLTDDDDEDDDEDDNHGHFALSLSLSSLGNDKHQLPHTPPLPPPAAAADEPQPSPSSSPPLRPKPVAAYKSSFSYTSTGSGVTGGFTSHSNTSSLSRNVLPSSSQAAPTSSSGSSMLSAPPMVASGSEPLPGGLSSSSSRTTSTSTSPSTVSTAFQPSHRAGQKSEPSISLSSAQALAHTSRPALSRGSLSTATGVLSSPPIPHSGGSGTESGGTEVPQGAGAGLVGVGEALEAGHAPGHDGDPASATKHGMPHIPLPPQVLRALGEDSRAPTGLGVDGFMTPPSVAATPFDGDPFASSAPADASLPPTPGVVEAAPSAVEPAAAGASPSPPQQDNGAVSLDWSQTPGPVDPRTYSAVTGLRDIEAFACEDGEAGKGAYGSVRRAREKGPDGKPIGVRLLLSLFSLSPLSQRAC